MQDFFEKLVGEQLDQTVNALLAAPLDDACKHAFIKGVHQGLAEALALYRKASRSDIEEAA